MVKADIETARDSLYLKEKEDDTASGKLITRSYNDGVDDMAFRILNFLKDEPSCDSKPDYEDLYNTTKELLVEVQKQNTELKKIIKGLSNLIGE